MAKGNMFHIVVQMQKKGRVSVFLKRKKKTYMKKKSLKIISHSRSLHVKKQH